MTIQDLGSIGELVGAIATVATLAYLAVQIRHNTRASRISSLQATLDGGRNHTIQPLITTPGHAELFSRGLTSLDSLEPADRVRFTWFVLEAVLQMQNVMQQYDEAILDDSNYEAWLAYTASILRTPGGAEVWPQVAAIVEPTIRNALQEHLASQPDQPSLIELMPVMDTTGWQ